MTVQRGIIETSSVLFLISRGDNFCHFVDMREQCLRKQRLDVLGPWGGVETQGLPRKGKEMGGSQVVDILVFKIVTIFL